MFVGADGTYPSGLAIGSGGVLYGTAQYGGSGQCAAQYGSGCGVVFELVPPPPSAGGWLEATPHNFTGGSNGAFPNTGIVIGSGGVLYGTTQPNANTATIFSLQPSRGLLPSINAGTVLSIVLLRAAGEQEDFRPLFAHPKTGHLLGLGSPRTHLLGRCSPADRRICVSSLAGRAGDARRPVFLLLACCTQEDDEGGRLASSRCS